mmetsp:Transcript_117729/g.337640  ORF Transcript_117729/g.337640 Transcript_117729/m.337640 type:complete len:154 (+) Transcript_117729:75-536(+)
MPFQLRGRRVQPHDAKPMTAAVRLSGGAKWQAPCACMRCIHTRRGRDARAQGDELSEPIAPYELYAPAEAGDPETPGDECPADADGYPVADVKPLVTESDVEGELLAIAWNGEGEVLEAPTDDEGDLLEATYAVKGELLGAASDGKGEVLEAT